jgi:hypothetical protein
VDALILHWLCIAPNTELDAHPKQHASRM